jgi:hypothetical protein
VSETHDSQRARTAFHEGYVCVARVLRIGVGGVSIVPDEHSYGRWTNHPTAPLDVDSARGRYRAQRLIGVGYAGVLAEQRAVELWHGRFADFLPPEQHSDLQFIVDTCRAMMASELVTFLLAPTN